MPSSSRPHRGGGPGGGGAADASSSSLVYDPAQDLAEKRALRKDYRSLIAKTDEARANLGEHDAVDLRKYIEDGEGLRGRREYSETARECQVTRCCACMLMLIAWLALAPFLARSQRTKRRHPRLAPPAQYI